MQSASGLVLFRDYLKQASAGNSSAPPVSIKAADLDNNFKRVSIVDTNQDNRLFTITEAGTIPKVVELDICVNGVPQKMRVIGTINTK
jgi:hypothetical protein